MVDDVLLNEPKKRGRKPKSSTESQTQATNQDKTPITSRLRKRK